MEQLAVFAIVAGAAYYVLQRLWSRSEGSCGGCNACPPPPPVEEKSAIVQIEPGPRAPRQGGAE